jgi:hypothetical protein
LAPIRWSLVADINGISFKYGLLAFERKICSDLRS